MAALAWPAAIDAALNQYATALESFPGSAELADAFRDEVLHPRAVGWGLAQSLSAFTRYRPHALLARAARARDHTGGMLNLLKWSRKGNTQAEPNLTIDWDHLTPWDDLATVATLVDVACAELPEATRRLAMLGETLDAWPTAPTPLPTDWPTLRDAFLQHYPKHATPQMLASCARRCALQEQKTPEQLLARGPSVLTRFIYRGLLAEQARLLPELDPTTLQPRSLPTDVHEVYRKDKQPLGTLLEVVRLAVPPEKPVLLFSAGPTVPAQLALALAPMNSSCLPVSPVRDRVVAARLRAIEQLKRKESVTEQVTFTTNERAWLDEIKAIPAAKPWYDAIVAWAGLQMLPMQNSYGDSWPDDVPLAQPGVCGLHDPAPVGTILSVEHYAIDPAEAKFTISLGPDAGASALAYDFWLAITTEENNAAAAELVDAIWKQQTPTAEQWLAVVSTLSATSAEAFRTLASEFGYLLIPWDVKQVTYEAGVAESVNGLRPVFVFRLNDPIGHVFRVRSFGLQQGQTIISPAEVSVSVGKPPPNLTEMEKLLLSCPADVVEPLKQAFTELRPAALNGYLEQAMIDLFQYYWKTVHLPWFYADAGAELAFSELLRQSLEDQFGLRYFEPRSVLEHPEGWIVLPPGTRVNSGRVKQILSPGLLDPTGVLRLPAFVVAD